MLHFEKRDYNKTILVCASGGFDSTVLIYENLIKKNRVIPLYIDTNIDNEQKKAEKLALRNILHYFNERFNHTLIDCWPVELILDIPYAFLVKLQQPQTWIFGSYLFVQGEENRIIDEVQLGYILEDHALSYMSEIRSLWNSLNRFQEPYCMNPIPKLSFPIIKYNKSRTMDIIAYNCPEIFDSIHFCEFPINKNRDGKLERCEKCHSCKKVHDWGYEQYKSNAKQILIDRNLKPYEIKKNDFKTIEKKIPQDVNLTDKKEKCES
jgi:7-cyano-7-deazaguanine synthase in queuosine biosynthesis